MRSIDDVGGRHPEFRERKPDLPPLPPLQPGPEEAEPRPLLVRLVWLCVAAAVAGVIAALVLALWTGGESADEAFLRTLQAAVRMYQADYGVLPADLRSLAAPGPRGMPYVVAPLGEPRPPGGARVEYRTTGPSTFDLRIVPKG